MNHLRHPDPENPPATVFSRPPSEIESGILGNSAPEAPLVRPGSSAVLRAVPPSSRSFTPAASHDHFTYPPMDPEPPPEPAYDYEDDAREYQGILDDLAAYNDDFSRSNEDGWFYSDED